MEEKINFFGYKMSWIEIGIWVVGIITLTSLYIYYFVTTPFITADFLVVFGFDVLVLSLIQMIHIVNRYNKKIISTQLQTQMPTSTHKRSISLFVRLNVLLIIGGALLLSAGFALSVTAITFNSPIAWIIYATSAIPASMVIFYYAN